MKRLTLRRPADVHQEIKEAWKTREFALGFHLALIVVCLLGGLILAIYPLI